MQAIEACGMTVDEMAERMGVAKQQMRKWAAGNPMRLDSLIKFCTLTGASADVLLGLKEPEKERDRIIGNVNIDEDPEKLVRILRRDVKELSRYRGPDAHMFFHIRRHEEVAADWIEEYILAEGMGEAE